MEWSDYERDLLAKDANTIYDDYLITGEVWYFKKQFGAEWFNKYDAFKRYISDKMGVHYNNIAIAGSAKVGFSMNPSKWKKSFDAGSDIDIIIISKKYYDRFWNSYLKEAYSPVLPSKYGEVCESIFQRFIIFDGFRSSNKEYQSWLKQTEGLIVYLQSVFEINHEINYRIFESWDAAKAYYVAGIEESKRKLAGGVVV